MSTKEDKIRQLKWQSEKQLEYIRAQINEIRPLKETDGMRWWKEYCHLKDQECVAEQDIAWCEKRLGKEKEEDNDHFDRRTNGRKSDLWR